MCSMILFFLGNEDIKLIQISFDGNNIENPPNLMTDDIVQRINICVERKFPSYINIVYRGEHDFPSCDTNSRATEELRTLLKKEK